MPRQTFMSLSFVRTRLAVAALAIAMLLSGCQGGTTPGSPASPTGSTTATPTTSAAAPAVSVTPVAPAAYKPADAQGKAQNVTVPVMPELAKENSKAGLEAFIGYWYAQLSYVGETGDMSAWLPLISQDCRLCLRLQESGEDGYVHGRWLAGGKISVPTIELQWTADALKSAKVQVIQEQIDYYNADGSVGRARSEASNDAFAFFARFADGAWTVVDLGVIG
ncbi:MULTISPECIES: DUF6318 family protein [unclassified Arthrobacter]|uniref:DUF6318 family protein n=1 Tax=unclassified Arthrobacter TaxID=235627 RepID=UPI001C6150A9|nr:MULTISPECIES: DUF6318 family protein [unclassified Arthrobacter]